MSFDEEQPDEETEIGSDELLSDDNLRLPEEANVLVRLHAIRAWLARRHREAELEIGFAALHLQEQQEPGIESRLRRRQRLQASSPQQKIQEAQQSLQAYEDAEELLEECVAHVTSSERVLVEYYLALEEQLEHDGSANWRAAISNVLSRVEHVSAPSED